MYQIKGDDILNISFYKEGKSLGARLTGELDHHGAPYVRECIDNRIMNGSNSLILDLTGLTFMDSSGIGLILGRYKLISDCGGTMSIITGKNKNINKLLAMCGITRIIPVNAE